MRVALRAPYLSPCMEVLLRACGAPRPVLVVVHGGAPPRVTSSAATTSPMRGGSSRRSVCEDPHTCFQEEANDKEHAHPPCESSRGDERKTAQRQRNPDMRLSHGPLACVKGFFVFVFIFDLAQNE